MYNYVASAQKATNVTHVCTGNFTAPTDHNLIVCKATRLQFHLLTSGKSKNVLLLLCTLLWISVFVCVMMNSCQAGGDIGFESFIVFLDHFGLSVLG